MDDPDISQAQSPETKNSLPDVVHSQQLVLTDVIPANESSHINVKANSSREGVGGDDDKTEFSCTESISEHVPSNVDYSLSEQDNKQHLNIIVKQENISDSSSNIPNSPAIQNVEPTDTSLSNLEVKVEVTDLRDESPLPLPLSSDISKDANTFESPSQPEEPAGTPRSKFSDSLSNEHVSHKSEQDDKDIQTESIESNKIEDTLENDSIEISGSEEIIKLDIRGQGAIPKFPRSQIIFGIPPEGGNVTEPNLECSNLFTNLLSPILVKAESSVQIEEIFDFDATPKEPISLASNKLEQSDLLVEEMTIQDYKEKEPDFMEDELASSRTQPKSMAPEETVSFSTLTTDYKTICEEYFEKLVHLEAAIAQRNQVIEELTVSLQKTNHERDQLREENQHLINEVQKFQHGGDEKTQLSDFVKYESMLKDDTRFYSAMMSSHSSLSSKGDQRDNVHEEITINYSRSDIRTSEDSDFNSGLENKIAEVVGQFDEFIEENRKNILLEKLMQVFVDETGRLRLDNDDELKQLEQQIQNRKVEVRQLRELLASIETGNVDVKEIRRELLIQHQREMESLRTYFEKKCSDMERSYSEGVLRERASSGEGDAAGGAGDAEHARGPQTDQSQLTQKLEEKIAALQKHITYLEKHTRSTCPECERTQTPPGSRRPDAIYQQDIDLELETNQQLFKKQIVQELLVLLSDPDAELSSWPSELAAVRDTLHADATKQTLYSSLRDEDERHSLGGDTKCDKWRLRRHMTFDHNRHLGEFSNERDELQVFVNDSQQALSHIKSYLVDVEPKLTQSPDMTLNDSSVLEQSAVLRQDLHTSLQRLQTESYRILQLISVHNKDKMADEQAVQITELVQRLQEKSLCSNCQDLKKSLEEVLRESLERENILRNDLQTSRLKVAELLVADDNTDVIAEGYGAAPSPRPASLPPSPRLQVELDALLKDKHDLLKERDDLLQQLESLNRFKDSSKKFMDEQAAERETERDEFAAKTEQLRDENRRLQTRLQGTARIMSEVEHLELQTKEMTSMINDLESHKTLADKQIKEREEKISILKEEVSNLEHQLEEMLKQKNSREKEIIMQLEEMRKTIDDRDSEIRGLLGQLENLRSDRDGSVCQRCDSKFEEDGDDVEKNYKEQMSKLESWINERCGKLERVHEECSASCSETTEDVSIKDTQQVPCGGHIWDRLHALSRAEDAAVKRIQDLEMQRAQLHEIAQELRGERDVLQARMSSQALRVSSLSARLDQTRAAAAADTARATAELSVKLCDATAQVERLQEELDTKDKQLSRVKNMEERESSVDKCDSPCEHKDKLLERKLAAAQTRIAQLEALCKALEADHEHFQKSLREHQRLLAEKETQLQELIELKLEEENQEQKSDINEGKHSARTLSDIVSISDYDEQDLQMRKAELKHNQSMLPPYHDNNKSINSTLPPLIQHKQAKSLMENLPENISQNQTSPRPESLPINLTSTVNKPKNFKRNINEMTILGSFDKYADSIKHSTVANIQDNTSMFPNRDVSDDKDVSMEPRRIDFSLEPSNDNRTHPEESISLRELGIDINKENFSDILNQFKTEITKYRRELQNCKSELKQAEEQLCEFPALKEEVEELKTVLENTMGTMDTDKKFYENQLKSFTSNKQLLEQRISELTKDATDKSKDLHLLKEDILTRENMILELAKEKRNLTNKFTELEVKIDELQSRNDALVKFEGENNQLKEKMSDYHKLELEVTEKNQQIDSLNQHLDRLDDLQRCLNEKTEEFDNLHDAFEEKSNEIFQLQATVNALNKDLGNSNEENSKLIINNKDLKLKLTKLEKEQDNYSLRHQSSETEIARLNAINKELSMKLEEFKIMTDKLKDKEYEIEILNEDINSFHLEIDSLKEQLKMASRSPSPRKSGDERREEGRLSGDKKQLVKIRKQISLLQHELDFNKKELNDKAYQLAKTKLDLTELKNSFSHQTKCIADKDVALESLLRERDALRQQLCDCERDRDNYARKLQDESDRVPEISGRSEVRSGPRSPTAELEQALQTQLDFSDRLDRDMLQILSSSSDSEEIPPLNLQTSNSRSSSIHSSSSERVQRLRSQNEHMRNQLRTNEDRIKDKDALIAELYRVRDTLSGELDMVRHKYETERDNCARLQLLLDTHKETADSLQSQDTNMIGILKQRLECCMRSELDLQQQLRELRQKSLALETELVGRGGGAVQEQLQQSLEDLRAENRTLRSKLELERNRYVELTAKQQRDETKLQLQINGINDNLQQHRTRLAEALRQKQELSAELSRNKQLTQAQTATIKQLQAAAGGDAMSELESHRVELSRDIASLRHCLDVSRTHAAQGQDKDYAVRYLHSRCVRLESCRKALVWQKRYLLHIAAACAPARWVAPLTGKRRFKCIALVVVVMCRMSYLVRRRNSARLLTRALATPAPCTGTSPPSRDVPESSRAAVIPGTPLVPPHFRLLLPHSPAPLLDEMFRRATPRASRVTRPECLLSAMSSPRGNDTPVAYIHSSPH